MQGPNSMRSLLLKRLKRGKQRFNTDCLLITKDVIKREKENLKEKNIYATWQSTESFQFP